MAENHTVKSDSTIAIKKEIKQYKKLLHNKTVKKYKSLEEMKKQLFNTLYNTYSDEDLDLLKEQSKVMVLDIDEDISVGTPVWTALNIAILSLIVNICNEDNIWCVYLYLILIVLSILFRKDNSLERKGFYNMILELIEIVEEKRKHSFNKVLLEM